MNRIIGNNGNVSVGCDCLTIDVDYHIWTPARCVENSSDMLLNHALTPFLSRPAISSTSSASTSQLGFVRSRSLRERITFDGIGEPTRSRASALTRFARVKFWRFMVQ